MTPLRSVAPVLPVGDLARAVEHYRGLGFEVTTYDGGGYGYANRDDVSLHLAEIRGYTGDPSVVSVYLYVADAGALAAEWGDGPCQDTPYGLREGHHLDPDGNLLRYGSPLES